MSITYRVVDQGEHLDGGRFNGEGRERKAWWWQAGPVDSCCCCFSLRAGVAMLATNDLLHEGIWKTFYKRDFFVNSLGAMFAESQGLYARQCAGDASRTTHCLNMAHTIEQLEDTMDILRDVSALYYVQGVMTIMAGVVGLWAVFRSNALAAKVYMWTWLPIYLMQVLEDVMEISKMKQYGLEPHPAAIGFALIINLFAFAYFVKVIWSYRQRLDGSSGHSYSTSPPAESSQLSSRYDFV